MQCVQENTIRELTKKRMASRTR